MIPFYKERLAFIEEEIEEKNDQYSNATAEEKRFLRNSKAEVENSLNKEK